MHMSPQASRWPWLWAYTRRRPIDPQASRLQKESWDAHRACTFEVRVQYVCISRLRPYRTLEGASSVTI
ncbi:hypothetical protein C8Q77DRAFT_1085292 [Trametes polyzona]|nr:hypothetical protein C8Q77DRAFT_1085292 [Trametes polyzona]